MNKIYYLIVFLFIGLVANAQKSDGKLDVIQDQKVDELLNKHLRVNEISNAIPGFRINIYSQSGNNSKTNAYQLKTTFSNKFPDVESYVVYDEPNFKVKVGDFRNRMEARGYLQIIKADFPDAFVVKDLINFPSIKP